MPRYLIERTWDPLDEEALSAAAARSKQLIDEQFPDIVWEHSHVAVDEEDQVRSFCVYSAPDADQVRAHAAVLGDHQIDRIHELSGDLSPADFPAGG